MKATRVLDIFLVIVGSIIVWQLAHEIIGEVALTSPWVTVVKAIDMLGSARFWPHAAATGLALGLSLVLAMLGGISIGVVLGAHRLSGAVAEPILIALYSVPKITLYPLILLIFGLGLDAKVVFGAIHGVVPVVIFTMNGVKNVNPIYLKSARAFNMTAWQTATTVLLPATLPQVVSGLRVGFSLTLLGVLIGEMFASQHGLGFLIINSISLHDVELMMAVTLLLATSAVIVSGVLLYIDNRIHRRA